MYDATFDANDYVKKNCSNYLYGLQSESDISKIENDSTLTSAQKEAAKRELKRLSDFYY